MKVLQILLGIVVAVQAWSAAGSATVKVLVFDGIGNRISDADIRLMRGNTAMKIKSDSLIAVPYGDYKVLTIVRGADPTEVEVRVDQPRQLIMIGMKLGGLEAPHPVCSVNGHIPANRNISRLHFNAVFGTYFADIDTSDTGEYSLQNVECGDYIVMAVGPKGCVGAYRLRLMDRTLRKDLKFDEPPASNGCPLVTQ